MVHETSLPPKLATRVQAAGARAATLIPGPLARALGPEADTWAVLLLVIPVVAVGLSLTVGLRPGHIPLVDNDYWWHLATGEWMLDHRAIPTTDPFSWTHQGQDWIAHEWLAEVILAAVVRVAGYVGAILLTAVIALAGFWRLTAGVRAYGVSRRAICLLTIAGGSPFLRQGVMTVRPQLWSFALFAVLLAALTTYETGRRHSLWLLLPLFVVWININLTALIGIACLGVFVLDRLRQRRLERHLLVVAMLVLATPLVNPRGPELLTAALSYADRSSMRYVHVYEWMPPQLDDPTQAGFFLALLLLPAAVVQLLRGSFWPAVPLLALAYESLIAMRFIPLYLMVGLVFTGWLVWRQAFGLAPIAAAAWTPLFPRSIWTWAAPLNAAAVVIIAAVIVTPSQFRREPVALRFPEEAATRILTAFPTARIFNVYDHGGYLIYRFHGQQLVYGDGREEMYGEPFMRQYWDLIWGLPGWQDVFAAENVTVAVVRRDDGLYEQLAQDPAWDLVQFDDFNAMFVRDR